jgi:hypothetical protein
MALLASARRKCPDLGYATDFVDVVMKSVLPEVKRRGIKVVSNAGGINPRGCAAALAKVAAAAGIELNIAVVEGDDVGRAAVAQEIPVHLRHFSSGDKVDAEFVFGEAGFGVAHRFHDAEAGDSGGFTDDGDE